MECRCEVFQIIGALTLCNRRPIAVRHDAGHMPLGGLALEIVRQGVSQPHMLSTSLFERPKRVAPEARYSNNTMYTKDD